jgi:hypothetical protein
MIFSAQLRHRMAEERRADVAPQRSVLIPGPAMGIQNVLSDEMHIRADVPGRQSSHLGIKLAPSI